MNRCKLHIFLFAAAVLMFSQLLSTSAAQNYPPGDLNGDFRVGLHDLKIFADQWLDSSGCSGLGCADFDSQDGVNMVDLAILSENWNKKFLVINEIMASNNDTIEDPEEPLEFPDWIEIYNASDETIDLSGMYLSDNENEPTKWRIPDGIIIYANDHIIFWADEDDEQGDYHTNFKLDADSDDAFLFADDGSTVIDGISFDNQYSDISYGRYPDGSNNWRFMGYPTPDANNDPGYLGKVADTHFSVNRGFYENPFQVRMACDTPDAQIRYTLDGDDPVEPNGAIYDPNFPIQITQTTCLRAAAYKPGWLQSNSDTQTYIFNADDAVKSLPVFSIVGDVEQSLYEPNGVMAIVGGYYVGGVWQSDGPDSYNNPIHRGIAYERPVSFEIIDLNAGNDVQIDCGIRVAGSDYHRPRYTRGDNWNYNYDKFSLKLFFRSEYGDNEFEYPFFPLAKSDKFKAVTLRGGHNDVHNPFIKDEMVRRLHQDMGGVAPIGILANLFINGDYKSFYNPCDRLDHDFFRYYYDVDTDWDVITQRAVRNGDYVAWYATLDFFKSNDLSCTANYEQASQMVDIVDFIDYLIIQLYCANWDWPSNNWTVSRERTPQGKFRFHCWDVEGSMETQHLNSFGFDDFPIWWPGGLNGLDTELGHLYRALKANTEFKVLFADRIQKHFFYDGALVPDHIEERFTELRQELSQMLPNMDTSVLTTWIPNRHQLMLDKFTSEDLFPGPGPDFLVNGLSQHGGHIADDDNLTIESSHTGTIYYTLNGTNPRAPSQNCIFEQTVIIPEDAPKKVYVPTYDIGTTWRGGSEPYDDSSWTHGTYIPSKTGGVAYERSTSDPILYDDYISYDLESEMYGIMTSCYIRIPFTVDAEDLAEFDALTLHVRCDDGFVAFLNGVEIASINKPDPFEWNSNCVNRDDDPTFVTLPIDEHISNLHVGTNILAIHALNTSTTSSDFLISVELIAGIDSFIPASVSPEAIEYTSSFTLPETTLIKSRILDNDQWSALSEAVFAVGPVADNLRITEIMYHPQDTNEPNDPNTEFIELKNTGAEAININLVRFTNGLDFTFGDITLNPDEHIIAVKDIDAFEAAYGTGYNIAGQYTGSLANEGERVRLEDGLETTILDFKYKDGWRSNTDGDGYSLTIINPDNPDANSWDEKDSWRPSAYVGGSPGWDDSGIIPNPGDITINEVLAHTDFYPNDWVELYNTTASAIDLTGWYLSDDDANLTKYELPSTTISANDYVVFTQDDHFGAYFALSENGEMLCLTSKKDANDNLTGYRQKEDFGASENGIAFGRYYKESTDNYNFVAMSENTPGPSYQGAANAYPKVGPVVISEIMYHPEIFWGNWDAEYIELTNITTSAVNLYDGSGNPWKITDGIDFTFPPYTSIPPGGCVLIIKDVNAFNDEFPSVPPAVQLFEWDSGRLDNDGEKVEISMPGGLDEFSVLQYIRIDRINYSNGSHPEDFDGITDPWPIDADGTGDSLERINLDLYGNDPNNWDANTPTPGIIPGAEWTILTYDDFETGWGSYTDGGDDCARLITLNAHQGSYAANIQDGQGDASSFYHTNGIDVDTPEYTQIKVDFWFKAVGMDTLEGFNAQYFDGSEWNVVDFFIVEIDFVNDQFYPITLYINEGTYDFPDDMKLKFECLANTNTDDIFIDEIAVYAK